MAKTLNIQTLLTDKAKEIVRSSDDWVQFMSSSAYIYKYPFEDQILIYAQRPEAKACATMDFWNKKFHRWVNRGAKGIPLIDYNSGGYPKLRYVFDISDTHPTKHTIQDVNLWEFDKEEHTEAILNLEEIYNISNDGIAFENLNLGTKIYKIAQELTDIRLPDILYDIENYRMDSLMEDFDEYNTKFIARDIISKSVAFTILKRMELNPMEYFETDDFEDIINFNTFDMISVMGSYTSQMTREIVSDITREINKIEIRNKIGQKNVQNILPKDIGLSYSMSKDESSLKIENIGSEREIIEGGRDHDKDGKWNSIPSRGRELQSSSKDQQFRRDGRDLQDRRELSNSKSSTRRRDDNIGQIWKDEGEISKGKQDELLHKLEDTREADEPSTRNREGSTENIGDGNSNIPRSMGSNRGIEEPESDEVGRDDEQYKIINRRDNPKGDNLHLDIIGQSTLFPTEENQMEIIERAVEDKTTVFYISQKNIDDVLAKGTGFQDGKYRVADFFNHNPTEKEAVEFLKKEYGTGGWATPERGDIVNSSNHDRKGIELIKGNILEPDVKVLLSWEKVSRRISELIKMDRYLNPKEQEQLEEYHKKLVDSEIETKNEELLEITYATDGNKVLNYELGATVYIGANEYSIIGFQGDNIELRDAQFPLFTESMSKSEFERKVGENSLNNHLFSSIEFVEQEDIKLVEVEKINEDINGITRITPYQASQLINSRLPEEDKNKTGKYFALDNGKWIGLDYSGAEGFVEEFDSKKDCLIWLDGEEERIYEGMSIDIGERSYIIDEIRGDTVSLQDITFSKNVGFPIFRKEDMDFILSILDEMENDEPIEKTKETEVELPVQEKFNFRIINDDLGIAGAKTKFQWNIEAIKTLKDIEKEERLATPKEQEILSKYVGWGGLSQAFDIDNPSWTKEYLELKNLLTTEEYSFARESTLNAYYTSPIIIKAMYEAMENMGFKTGNILDPGLKYWWFVC